VNPVKHLLFIFRQRRTGNRLSSSAYLKGYDFAMVLAGAPLHEAVLNPSVFADMPATVK